MLKVLTRGAILGLAFCVVSFFKKIATWHILIGSLRFSAQIRRL